METGDHYKLFLGFWATKPLLESSWLNLKQKCVENVQQTFLLKTFSFLMNLKDWSLEIIYGIPRNDFMKDGVLP